MTGKRIVIVGASSGIGSVLATLLAAKGNALGITGRRGALLYELKNKYPGNIYVSSFDIQETHTCPGYLEELVQQMGGLDLLVISAGNGEVNEALDFSVENEMIALNVCGFTCVADWAFNYFLQQGYGHLVAITSLAGLRGSRQAPAYSATKAYQIRYLESLRQKAFHLQKEIIVTDICPGFVDTPMAKSPVKFWVAPVEKAAKQIVQAIDRRKNTAYITRRWQIIAWIYRYLPDFIHKRL
ncbi:SDR family NAD(P)-dependent oxidoreductase [Olivibacter sp. SA151]|uniref:SDR family NAD(P)-dependent oxidoreductase n=1 Tax=Olivibacter jilunii TaxID=985016 RepID=UPI003F18F78A